MENENVRVNVRVSAKIKAWFEAKSMETGISQSALMSMALDEWIFQKETIKTMTDMGVIASKLDEMQMQIKELSSDGK